VQTGEKIADVPVEAATFTVAWHPKQYLLAYACDDKDSYDRKRDAGSLKVFGFANDWIISCFISFILDSCCFQNIVLFYKYKNNYK